MLAVVFSARFDDALTFAALRHDGQIRKESGAPYLTHLVAVARVVSAYGYDEDHEITALLHDVLEDTCQNHEEREAVAAELEVRFGPAVATAVGALSEPKRDDAGARLAWPERKQAYITRLETATPLALRVSAADKIHNLATMLAGLEQRGPDLWRAFRGGPKESAWFYRSVQDVLRRRLEEPIVEELTSHVQALEARAAADEDAL